MLFHRNGMIPRDIFCDKQTNICPQLWKYVSPTDIYSQQRESVYCNTIRFLGYVFMSFNIYSSGENSGIYTLSNNIRTWLGCALFSWWRHQMETFAALSVLCKGNSPVTVIICNAYPLTNVVPICYLKHTHTYTYIYIYIYIYIHIYAYAYI